MTCADVPASIAVATSSSNRTDDWHAGRTSTAKGQVLLRLECLAAGLLVWWYLLNR